MSHDSHGHSHDHDTHHDHDHGPERWKHDGVRVIKGDKLDDNTDRKSVV